MRRAGAHRPRLRFRERSGTVRHGAGSRCDPSWKPRAQARATIPTSLDRSPSKPQGPVGRQPRGPADDRGTDVSPLAGMI
jgi:hypothetical protein